MSEEQEPRSRRSAVGLGAFVAAGVTGVLFLLASIPILLLAAADSDGLDRPDVRIALTRLALPGALVLGLAAGAVAGRWWRRGGQLPSPDRDAGSV